MSFIFVNKLYYDLMLNASFVEWCGNKFNVEQMREFLSERQLDLEQYFFVE